MQTGRAAKTAKEAREEAGLTQLQLSMDDLFTSREAVSAQENARYHVQPELANYYAKKHNNPWVGLEAASEYVGWGPPRLDGEAVDLHRSSVATKTVEELEEALNVIHEAVKKLNINPQFTDETDKQTIKKSILEVIDVITAANHYVAVLCREYDISWSDMWNQHKMKLIQRRFLRK